MVGTDHRKVGRELLLPRHREVHPRVDAEYHVHRPERGQEHQDRHDHRVLGPQRLLDEGDGHRVRLRHLLRRQHRQVGHVDHDVDDGDDGQRDVDGARQVLPRALYFLVHEVQAVPTDVRVHAAVDAQNDALEGVLVARHARVNLPGVLQRAALEPFFDVLLQSQDYDEGHGDYLRPGQVLVDAVGQLDVHRVHGDDGEADGHRDQVDGGLRRLAVEEPRLEQVLAGHFGDERAQHRLDDQHGDPAAHEAQARAEHAFDVGVVAARLGYGHAQLDVAQRADHADHPAHHPHCEGHGRAAHGFLNLRGAEEYPASHDAAHHHGNGGGEAEPLLQLHFRRRVAR